MKKNIILFCMITFLLSGCQSGDYTNNEMESNNIEISDDRLDDTIYSVDLIREDMEYFKDSYIKLHHGLKDTQIKNNFLDNYDRIFKSINGSITKEKLFFKLSQLIIPLEDGHAIIENPDEKFFLPFKFRWTEDGLFVVKSNIELVEVGDKVIEINDKEIDDLLNSFKAIVSAENVYWVKVRGAEMIRMKHILEYLDCVNNNSVLLKIQKPNGIIVNKTVDLVTGLKTYMGSTSSPDPYYKSLKEHNAAIFIIPSCRNDSNYKNVLEDFFEYVQENNISRIIVDLRDNMGGDSGVLDEFLKYIDIENVNYFYEHNSIFGNRTTRIEHTEVELYGGEIYIATSNNTFSSAVLFTGVIKYNDIGLTIGEPTGNATIRYGYSNKFELPNTKLKYVVTSKKWVLPNVGYEPTIMPDILLPYKLEHILNEVDPIEEWIKSGV